MNKYLAAALARVAVLEAAMQQARDWHADDCQCAPCSLLDAALSPVPAPAAEPEATRMPKRVKCSECAAPGEPKTTKEGGR
jgi:hypothetical protein